MLLSHMPDYEMLGLQSLEGIGVSGPRKDILGKLLCVISFPERGVSRCVARSESEETCQLIWAGIPDVLLVPPAPPAHLPRPAPTEARFPASFAPLAPQNPVPASLPNSCVVDPGLAVDPVDHSAPNPSRSPDPPQTSFGLSHHRSRAWLLVT
jgi:hypothetical protein